VRCGCLFCLLGVHSTVSAGGSCLLYVVSCQLSVVERRLSSEGGLSGVTVDVCCMFPVVGCRLSGVGY
jgi:hypothetical protein